MLQKFFSVNVHGKFVVQSAPAVSHNPRKRDTRRIYKEQPLMFPERVRTFCCIKESAILDFITVETLKHIDPFNRHNKN